MTILPDEGAPPPPPKIVIQCSEYEEDGYTCVNRDLCKKCKQDDENCFTERFEAAPAPGRRRRTAPEEPTCDDKNQICCHLTKRVEPGIN